MKGRRIWGIAALVVIVGLGVGHWLGRSAGTLRSDSVAEPSAAPRSRPLERPHPTARSGERPERPGFGDAEAGEAGAYPGQRSITFSSREAMERFLARLEDSGVFLLGRLDALHTLRVGFLDPDALAALLDGDEELGMIFPVTVPGNGSVQDDAVAFGRQLMEWLGLPDDRSGWGAGIKVAVIDTGVSPHSAFGREIGQTSYVDGDASENGHGTAVASLIASELGIAPDAEILSFQVADADGRTNTYTLAEAILAAADSGAQVINISMGQSSPSALLAAAIEYAREMGVVIVASAGNEGYDQVAYPAAYDDVISAAAIDARGEHIDFSNSGAVDLAAPGLGVPSAWPGEEAVLFSGTSASAPIVSGSIVMLMSQLGLDANAAAELLLSQTNEAGAPGDDAYYGGGNLDPARALTSNQAGLYDVAVASNYLTTTTTGEVVQVVIENRGTATVVNAPVTVTTPSGDYRMNVGTLSPGQIKVLEVPWYSSTYPQGTAQTITSEVSLSDGNGDLDPSNNRRVDVVQPAETP